MLNLKPVYDAAQAADAKVNGIMAEMLEAFNEGTEEGKQKALDLRQNLEEAKAEAKTANDLYVSMRDALGDQDAAARKFVPVNGAEQAQGKKVITRKAFEALDFKSRHDFLVDGGTVEDTLAE